MIPQWLMSWFKPTLKDDIKVYDECVHDWVDGSYNVGSTFGFCTVICKKCGIESIKLFD